MTYGQYFVDMAHMAMKDLEFLTPSETSKACDKRHKPRWRSNNLAFTSAVSYGRKTSGLYTNPTWIGQPKHCHAGGPMDGNLGRPRLIRQSKINLGKLWIGRYQRYQGARRSKGCTPPDGLPQERTQDSECRRLELVGFTVVRLFLESIYDFFGLKK